MDYAFESFGPALRSVSLVGLFVFLAAAIGVLIVVVMLPGKIARRRVATRKRTQEAGKTHMTTYSAVFELRNPASGEQCAGRQTQTRPQDVPRLQTLPVNASEGAPSILLVVLAGLPFHSQGKSVRGPPRA
jgi:hypothetical protein